MTEPDLSGFARKQDKKVHPRGWEPGVRWDGSRGTITAQAVDEPDPAIWRALIDDWGLDPTRTEVVPGSVQIRAWDVNVGGGEIQRLKYYRAALQSRQGSVDHADVEALVKIATKKPKRPVTSADAHACGSFVALLTDWQVGNGEAGGSEAIVANIKASLSLSIARAKSLRARKVVDSTVYLIGLGDLAEGCDGWYPSQTFSVDLNIREQDRVVRHLLMLWIDAFVDAGFRVVVLGVPGNHGEQRKNGKAYTDWARDNRDVACFEIVAEALAQNPERYGEVFFPQVLDQYDMTATLDINGVAASFAHGHQFSRSGAGTTVIENWLKGQALGRQAVADCDILFAGHRHHFLASEATGRTIFQAPASDTGSAWWTAQTGAHSPAGVLTVVVGTGCGSRGWTELAIL